MVEKRIEEGKGKGEREKKWKDEGHNGETDFSKENQKKWKAFKKGKVTQKIARLQLFTWFVLFLWE